MNFVGLLVFVGDVVGMEDVGLPVGFSVTGLALGDAEGIVVVGLSVGFFVVGLALVGALVGDTVGTAVFGDEVGVIVGLTVTNATPTSSVLISSNL